MMRHLPIARRFEPGRLERIDEPLFQVAAHREAVINAICHQTYTHAGGAVSVAIYDDRLEIWSDGTLPFAQGRGPEAQARLAPEQTAHRGRLLPARPHRFEATRSRGGLVSRTEGAEMSWRISGNRLANRLVWAARRRLPECGDPRSAGQSDVGKLS